MKYMSMTTAQNVKAILLIEEINKKITDECKRRLSRESSIHCVRIDCPMVELCYNITELEKTIASKIK